MRKEEYYLIVNRLAGKGRVEKIIRFLLKEFDSRKIPYEWWLTRRPYDAIELAQEGVRTGFKKIVVVGGDGTVNEAVEGFLSSGKNKEISLGIIPGGTGNDFARALGIPSDPQKALEILLAGKTLKVDVGRVLLNEKTEKYFVNALGLGLDAQAAKNAQAMENIKADLAYSLATVKELFVFPCSKFSLKMPHWQYADKKDKKSLGIIVANGRSEGKVFKVAPSALLNDGFFNVCILGSIPRFLFPLRFIYALGALGGLLEKLHRFLPWIYFQKTEKLVVTVPPGWLCHLDGNVIELAGIEKLEIEILPQTLSVITGNCPEQHSQHPTKRRYQRAPEV